MPPLPTHIYSPELQAGTRLMRIGRPGSTRPPSAQICADGTGGRWAQRLPEPDPLKGLYVKVVRRGGGLELVAGL